MEMRFWKVDPLSDSASVFSREAAEFTGAEGSIHPSPVPDEPETEKMLSDDVDCLVIEDEERVVVKPDACWLARKKPTAMEGSFMMMVLFFEGNAETYREQSKDGEQVGCCC